MKTIISSEKDSLSVYFKKVWQHKSLILTLAKRDLKIKYAQTSLGLLWTAIQPLTGLLIFTIFFNQVMKIDGIPESGYAVFAFTGMTSWYFFSYLVYQGSTSLLSGQELMKKIYFPKLILPLSKVLVGLVDFGISMILLVIIMMVNGIAPSWHIVFLPFFIVLNIIVGLSVSIWLSALTVKKRDLQHIVPYLINFGIWMTPIFFPATLIPEKFRFLLYFNPMAGIVEGFRWCIWEYGEYDIKYMIGIVLSIILLLSGVWYFKNVEDEIVDYI